MLSSELKEQLQLIVCGDRVLGKKMRMAQTTAIQHFKLDDDVINDKKANQKEDDYDDKYKDPDASVWKGAKMWSTG